MYGKHIATVFFYNTDFFNSQLEFEKFKMKNEREDVCFNFPGSGVSVHVSSTVCVG